MNRIKNKSLLFIAAFSLPLLAQAGEQVAATPVNSYNALLITLITLIFALLIVIGILGNVLRQLGHTQLDRLREERRSAVTPKAVLLLLGLSFTAIYAKAQETTTAATPAVPTAPVTYSGIPATQFYLLIGTICLELLVITAMVFFIRMLVRQMVRKPETAPAAETKVRRPFWDKFHNVVAVGKEEEIMLDHDYDGIKELDNSLPPWWKYGFYVTILVAVVYMYYYHMGGNGPSSLQEYTAEVEKGEAEKAAYLAKSASNVDETNVKMLDAAGIAAGQATFQNMCAACHAKDGGGGVGPNLTDEYWLHGGSINDVFKSIKYGWVDKGMKSWKDDFSPKQIAELASYVRSLKGSKPAVPKDKQGELYIEGEAKADSTKVAIVK